MTHDATPRDAYLRRAGVSHVAAALDGSTLAMVSVTETRVIIADIRPDAYLRSPADNCFLRDLHLA